MPGARTAGFENHYVMKFRAARKHLGETLLNDGGVGDKRSTPIANEASATQPRLDRVAHGTGLQLIGGKPLDGAARRHLSLIIGIPS